MNQHELTVAQILTLARNDASLAVTSPEIVALRRQGAIVRVDPVTGELEVEIQPPVEEALAYLRILKRVRYLKIASSSNSSRASADATLLALADRSALQTLEIKAPSFSDEGMECLAGCPRLEKLIVPRSRITERGWRVCATLNRLKSLDLSYSAISAVEIRCLSSVPGLQYLCLEGTLVGDEIAVMARNWPALRTLDLGYTPVSDAAIESLAALPATLVLGLTGSLVTEAGFLRLQRLLPKAAIHWKPTLSVLGWWRPETQTTADGELAPLALSNNNPTSLKPFVDPRRLVDSHWETADRKKIIHYLKEAPSVFIFCGPNPSSCLFCGVYLTGVYNWQNDGRWSWHPDLAHYVECHDVRLPSEFVADIRQRNYRILATETANPKALLHESVVFWRTWCQRQLAAAR